MQTNFNLPEKYAEMGYELHKVSGESLALRFQGHLIMIFSGIDASEGLSVDFATVI